MDKQAVTAKGKTILQTGWKQYSGGETVETPLPEPTEGSALPVDAASVKEGKTTPPKHYTEDTLLAAMENAGAKDAPEDAERRGLGTPATRAAILEKLVSAGFAERKKLKKAVYLIPTQIGNSLITVLPEQLQSPLLTAEWEHKLKQVERGELDADAFLGGIILMTLEDNDFSFEQAWALLSSSTPLADVFKEFENRETDYMDVVRESMASRANTIIGRNQAPLYPQDAAYAVAHNEMEHYTASLRINTACKNMIEDAIAAAYRDNSLKYVQEASKAVIDTFGFDRTMFVLANTIRIKSYDGRISPENKAWAQTIPICEAQRNIIVDRCNPGLLDLFTNQVRKDSAAEQSHSQQKASVREKLRSSSEKTVHSKPVNKEQER